MCATGRRQSPVAVYTAAAAPASLGDGYDFNFGTTTGLAGGNTGHAVQVT